MAKGKSIPMITVCHIAKGKLTKAKKPMYVLRSKAEEMAYQENHKDTISFWYGTWCKKCCGCYPKFFSEESFNSLGYYVCMVCGKESKHEPMPWMARDDWNNGVYEYTPSEYQFTIYDFMERKERSEDDTKH
jgi:hypothetical protein